MDVVKVIIEKELKVTFNSLLIYIAYVAFFLCNRIHLLVFREKCIL